MNEPTLEEIEQLRIDYERGFYVEFRNGNVHAGKDDEHKPVEGVRVFQV